MKVALLAALVFISGCTDSLESQQKKWEGFVSKNRYGFAADVWLVKLNALGQYEKVGVIFGFMDDYQFCTEIADLYTKRYPLDSYTCQLSN